MKINNALVSRSLIALLFVVAGLQKLMSFGDTVSGVGALGVPFPMIATILVIIIEIVVALMFAFGYKTRTTGWILVGFTALVTVVVHRDFSNQVNMVMALKNLAIIGGIMAAVSCSCGTCVVHKDR